MTQAINLANFSNSLDTSGGVPPSQLNSAVPISKGGTGQATAVAGFNALSTSAVYIDGSSNVGIGTTSPAFKFDVQGVVARVGGATAGAAVAYTQYGSSATDLNNFILGVETGAFAFYQGKYGGTSTERMRIDSSGNVGIGTSSPTDKLTVSGVARTVGGNGVYASGTVQTGNLYYGWEMYNVDSSINYLVSYNRFNSTWMNSVYTALSHQFFISGTEQARIDSAGLFKFNSGYGSAATAYGCRAWVNFNGTGTVAIRANGNVTSITDNGVGDYTINFTTAMPDANYAVAGSSNSDGTTFGVVSPITLAAGSVRITIRQQAGSFVDYTINTVSIIR